MVRGDGFPAYTWKMSEPVMRVIEMIKDDAGIPYSLGIYFLNSLSGYYCSGGYIYNRKYPFL